MTLKILTRLISEVGESLAKEAALKLVALGQNPEAKEAEMRVLAGESKGYQRFAQELVALARKELDND